jgi:hypothetical protein
MLKIFVQVISNRLHNNFGIKPIHKKVLHAATTKPPNRKAPPAPTTANINTLQAKSIFAPTCLLPMIDQNVGPPKPNALDEAIIVSRARGKTHILDPYKERSGSDFENSIVSKKNGKI